MLIFSSEHGQQINRSIQTVINALQAMCVVAGPGRLALNGGRSGRPPGGLTGGGGGGGELRAQCQGNSEHKAPGSSERGMCLWKARHSRGNGKTGHWEAGQGPG